MKRSIISLSIVVFTVIATGTANAVFVPSGLGGSPYHLAFVTQGTRDALSNSITDYNDFVNAQAALNPSATGTDIGVEYRVIGSTHSPEINARDNIGLVEDVPIYLMVGTKVADSVGPLTTNGANWLFGCCEAGAGISLTNPLNKDQFGTDVGNIKVWTGSGGDGLANGAMTGTIPGAELGTTLITFGKSGESGSAWMYNSTAFVTDNGTVGIPFEKPFYAVSQLLPEPSSVILLGFGGAWLVSLGRRRTRKS